LEAFVKVYTTVGFIHDGNYNSELEVGIGDLGLGYGKVKLILKRLTVE
jgi:hypothetical protein